MTVFNFNSEGEIFSSGETFSPVAMRSLLFSSKLYSAHYQKVYSSAKVNQINWKTVRHKKEMRLAVQKSQLAFRFMDFSGSGFVISGFNRMSV